jgi:hypothetical protein
MLVDYGWEMGMVGNVPLVLRVDAASDAAVKGLSPGDQVLTLNRFQPDRANLWRISYFYRYIRPQAQQHIVVRKPDGAERTLDVKSRVVKKPPTELDDLIEEMSAVNKHDVVLAIEKRRDRETQEHVKPTKNPFTGSLIVLVDSRSASAAEMFARIVQLEKRGTVMGDRTAGAVMESQFFAHSVGLGAVAFYATSVTVADIRMADGMSLEKAGVVPDQAILPTAADLAARRDPVLARALALAGTEMTPEKAAALFDEKR